MAAQQARLLRALWGASSLTRSNGSAFANNWTHFTSRHMSEAAQLGLRERLQQDLRAAMKKREEKGKLIAIRSVLSAVTQADKAAAQAEPGQLASTSVIARELRKLERQHKDAIDQYTQGGFNEQAEEEKYQLSIVSTYLPQQLSSEEIEAHVREAITTVAAKSLKDLGKVMKHLEATVDEAVAPRNVVAETVKRLITGQAK